MHKIETKLDLLKWCKEVNQAKMQCDLQDIYAMSDQNDIHELFTGLDQNEKELAIFCVQKCMGSHTFFDLMKAYINHKVIKQLEIEGKDIDERWTAVLKHERKVKQQNDQLKLTISNLTYQNAELTKDNNRTNKDCCDYHNHNINLQAEVDDLQERIDKLTAFESHIKELLTG